MPDCIPTYVISDTHLGHTRIREYCPGRQAWSQDIQDHDAKIVEAMNDLPAGSVLLHLGDFGFGSKPDLEGWVAALRYPMILVLGNHDRHSASFYRRIGIDLVVKQFEFQAPHGAKVLCRHNPGLFTDQDIQAYDMLLHGHTHGTVVGYGPRFEGKRVVDCGIDAHPWSVMGVGPAGWSIEQLELG